MIMFQNGNYESWKKTYEQVKDERTYLSIGCDHNRADNIDTLALYLNAIHEIEHIEDIITLIITSLTIDF